MKFSDSELLIDSLHRKINELQSVARSQQDYELMLSNAHNEYEQEIISLNEKLHKSEIHVQDQV